MRDTEKISANNNEMMVTPTASGTNPEKIIDNLVQSFANILARPRQKEYIVVPCAGWPAWPDIFWPSRGCPLGRGGEAVAETVGDQGPSWPKLQQEKTDETTEVQQEDIDEFSRRRVV